MHSKSPRSIYGASGDKAETAVVLMDSDFIFSDGSLLHLHEQRLAANKPMLECFCVC